MTDLFEALKSQSGGSELLKQAMENVTASSEGNDDEKNYWRPAVDKAGNGMATFRFLPAPGVDGAGALPWAKIWSHGFQGPGGQWLVTNCLTTPGHTKGNKCPVCEHNAILWNSGIKANRDIVSKQKRKLHYVSNVYVISDPKNPENEGRVVLFKYGVKIFDKIQEALKPQFPDEPEINAFDLWKGANFKLKIRKVEGYANYDKSEFDTPGPLLNDDGKLKAIWQSEFSLKEVVSDDKFISFEETQKRLNLVLGLNNDEPVLRQVSETVRQDSEYVREPRTVESVQSKTTTNDETDYFASLRELADED